MNLPSSVNEMAATSSLPCATVAAEKHCHPLQQAIFTSARTQRSDGYHLVALTAGIEAEDTRALTAWGPSHDSLQDDLPRPYSINFFDLPGGGYCLSKTFHYGMEHSLREGARCYTHCLIIDASALELFANHALSLFAWAEAQRVFSPRDTNLDNLPNIELPSEELWGAADLDTEQQFDDPRAATVIEMLATVPAPLGLIGAGDCEALLTATLGRLSYEDRPQVSLTTGLRPSPRRPFRVTCLPDDRAVQRHARRMGIHLVDLGAP